MGLLDRAKKLAQQAKDLAEDALAEAKARQESAPGEQGRGDGEGPSADSRLGTPYVPGMLGRPGWREHGLVDPAAVLPVDARDRVGVPHSTKSTIVEEAFGMGRRWSSGDRSAGLFYQLYPEHRSWQAPGGTVPVAELAGARAATLPDGRALVFLTGGDRHVVVEVAGIDRPGQIELAGAVAAQLSS